MSDYFYSLEELIWEGWRTLSGKQFGWYSKQITLLANEENQ